jgi:hypothetical protein
MKAERRWRKTGLPSDSNAFKTIKNQVTHLMNQPGRSFYTDFDNNNTSDQGKLFRAAKKLLNKNENCLFLKIKINNYWQMILGNSLLGKL